MLLEFTIRAEFSLLYVVAGTGEVTCIPLPTADATLQRVLPELLQRSSRTQSEARGRDPDGPQLPDAGEMTRSRELFASLIPVEVWLRLRTARRVFIAAHRSLHRMPFELLVTDVKDGRPVYWLDVGPEIAYVPSGSVLHWLRRRTKDEHDAGSGLDLLAIGDPGLHEKAPEVPEDGALVSKVTNGGLGARAGLRAQDVLVGYDGQPVVDSTTWRTAYLATEKAIRDGTRGAVPIPVAVWRRGEILAIEVAKGPLGIQVATGKARDAFRRSLAIDVRLGEVRRAGDLERLQALPPLRGARAETEAITKAWRDQGNTAKCLLGAEATESAVFDLSGQADYVHFACHGIAEEYAGQSLSMLVLSPPTVVYSQEDGLLELGDLFHRWGGRLSACRLVVLSACHTNIGPSFRDDAPQALPLGFLFAGAASVVSSLWAVDDDSTRILMTDFYRRLLAGETDRLHAFHLAKKALRAKYPDPYYWAPFLYIGLPGHS